MSDQNRASDVSCTRISKSRGSDTLIHWAKLTCQSPNMDLGAKIDTIARPIVMGTHTTQALQEWLDDQIEPKNFYNVELTIMKLKEFDCVQLVS